MFFVATRAHEAVPGVDSLAGPEGRGRKVAVVQIENGVRDPSVWRHKANDRVVLRPS